MLDGRQRSLTSVRGACGRAVQKSRRSRHPQVGHRNIAVAVHAVTGGAVIRLLRRGAGGVSPRGDAACVANVSLTTEETGQVSKALPTVVGPNVDRVCPHPSQTIKSPLPSHAGGAACLQHFIFN